MRCAAILRLTPSVRCKDETMMVILFLVAIILGLVGFAVLSSNPILGVVLLLVGFAMLMACLKRKPKARVSIYFQRPSSLSPRKIRKSKRGLKSIGNVDAICPHCNQPLDKKPSRKKKCPHCGEFIFVRTRPSDEQRVLVTEDQAEEIEEQWSIVNGTHGEYLAKKKRFADEKAKLAKRFGREPSDNDITWSLLNQELMVHASQQNWGLFRNAKMQMADILRKESRLVVALGMYFEVCYLDLNGPNNMSGVTDRKLLKQFPPWNPKQDALLAPSIVGRIARLIQKTETDERQAEELFVSRASKLKESLRLPVTVGKAWTEMRKALY
jgi:DNA-directed RNA polymerase subunit RPC12/RpoP